jgi:hypothetical protein
MQKASKSARAGKINSNTSNIPFEAAGRICQVSVLSPLTNKAEQLL